MKMKSEKGLTLSSVIVYIIGMLIMATVIGTITIYFYNNLVNASDVSKASIEYAKFNIHFLDDVKQRNNKVANIDNTAGLIQFSNGASYFYINNSIYKDNIKICDGITHFEITPPNPQNTKQIIGILMSIDDRTYTTKYVVGTGY